MTGDQAQIVERLLPGVVRRVLGGRVAQPWWLPRRALTVVAADVDVGVGVGAVWMVARPRSARAREYVELVEWYDGQWRYVGGGSADVDGPADGDVEVIEVRGGSGTLSLTRYLDRPQSFGTAPWIACVRVHLGPDVGHLLVGDRRIEASPGQRGVVAVWKVAQVRRLVRPVIVAVGRDGSELSRMGPLASLDSRTWARVREQLRGAGESEGL
ncbi:hypothetical protein [Streptomyces sp. NPDC047042]|uniref:hypothetical protein n=1 Tax=Streptomyces sp. NPDC047042 TaxID=3154807 RepID=UPI0033FA1CBA